MLQYQKKIVNSFFWRTTQQQEIDYVEETNGSITAYEFKWKDSARTKIPPRFLTTYGATAKVFTRDNFREFIK